MNMIPKKSIQPDDDDILNPMAGVRNYGAGTEAGLKAEEEDTPGEEKNGNTGEKTNPFPDEIALPKEQDDNDEFVLKQ